MRGITYGVKSFKILSGSLRRKNISKAANSLHISQPSLSRQLKNLEEELGVTLFYRGHQEITLTQEGYYLQEHAEEIISLAK